MTTEIAPEATPVSEATLPADLETAEPAPAAPVSEATAPAPAEEETVTAEPALAEGEDGEKPASKRRGWWTVNT